MSKSEVFLVSMVLHYAYLGIVLWSVVFPAKRIWPPLERWTWKYLVSWGLFLGALGADVVIMVSDKSSLLPIGEERYYLGVPLAFVGLLFLVWGAFTLGITKSLGVAGEFVATGPYRFTRNPQYLGDILLFLGMMVISNSFLVVTGLALLILALLLMPLAEEPWLEEMYGEAYREYKMTTPRFF